MSLHIYQYGTCKISGINTTQLYMSFMALLVVTVWGMKLGNSFYVGMKWAISVYIAIITTFHVYKDISQNIAMYIYIYTYVFVHTTIKALAFERFCLSITVETLTNECSGTQANDHCREWVHFSEVILTYILK